MKILLDESVPQKLRLFIEEGHTVATAWFQGWSGFKNGALLDAAEQAGFDLLITADQEFRYQQNLSGRKIAFVVLSTNNWSFIKAHVASIMAAINAATPGSYAEVEIPEQE
jgi:predicted nuclease of predicted toxin-antitoxin system